MTAAYEVTEERRRVRVDAVVVPIDEIVGYESREALGERAD